MKYMFFLSVSQDKGQLQYTSFMGWEAMEETSKKDRNTRMVFWDSCIVEGKLSSIFCDRFILRMRIRSLDLLNRVFPFSCPKAQPE